MRQSLNYARTGLGSLRGAIWGTITDASNLFGTDVENLKKILDYAEKKIAEDEKREAEAAVK